jgi:hypothetical protein
LKDKTTHFPTTKFLQTHLINFNFFPKNNTKNKNFKVLRVTCEIKAEKSDYEEEKSASFLHDGEGINRKSKQITTVKFSEVCRGVKVETLDFLELAFSGLDTTSYDSYLSS